MLFGETIITVDSASLIGGLTTAGTIIGGGILGAAKLISAAAGRVDSTMQRLHEENREDRSGLLRVMNEQWEALSRLAQNTRVTAEATKQIKRKVGAGPSDEDSDTGRDA